jgi:ribonuclease Z
MAVATVVHKVPTEVWQDQRYQSWMASFGPETRHLIADTKSFRNDIVYFSGAWNTLKLSLLDADLFPLPFCATPSLPEPSLPPNSTFLLQDHQAKLHPPGPVTTFQTDRDIPYPTSLDLIHEARRRILTTDTDLAKLVMKGRSSVRSDPRWDAQSRYPGEDITVTTLGTGSAIPSKHRNVSSTHLDIPGLGGILLDAGEGTLGQLRRRYGLEGLKEVYKDLKMVFISHMHADHHLGLQAVLEDRFRVSS